MNHLKIENDGKNTSIHLEEYLNMVYDAIITLADRYGTPLIKLMEFIKKQYQPHGLDKMVDANIFRAIIYGVKHNILTEVKPYGIKTCYKLAISSVGSGNEDGIEAEYSSDEDKED